MTSPVRQRRRQIVVYLPDVSGHSARPRRAYSGVGPDHHSDGSRRCAPRRPARPRTGGRRRGRLLLRSPAFLPPHVALPTACAAAITLRRGELPGKTSKIPEPLAALAPLEVAARGRVDPGRLVALSTNVLVLLRNDGAAPADGRHWRWCRGRHRLLARYGLLGRSLTRHHDGDGRVSTWLRWSGHRRRPTRVGGRLPTAHDAVARASCFGSRVVHQRIIGRSLPP